MGLWIFEFFFFKQKNPHIIFSPLYPKLALKPLLKTLYLQWRLKKEISCELPDPVLVLPCGWLAVLCEGTGSLLWESRSTLVVKGLKVGVGQQKTSQQNHWYPQAFWLPRKELCVAVTSSVVENEKDVTAGGLSWAKLTEKLSAK